MAKYLIQGSYTTEGAGGLVKEGGSGRKKMVENMLKKAGGKLESFYFAFGDSDVYVICDVPDNVTATSIALAVNSAGSVHSKTVVLLTPEEVDQAVKKTVAYRAPGK